MAEYITEGAVLRCDQGQYATELKILSSRMCIGGKLAANHKDCVPNEKYISIWIMFLTDIWLFSESKGRPGTSLCFRFNGTVLFAG